MEQEISQQAHCQLLRGYETSDDQKACCYLQQETQGGLLFLCCKTEAEAKDLMEAMHAAKSLLHQQAACSCKLPTTKQLLERPSSPCMFHGITLSATPLPTCQLPRFLKINSPQNSNPWCPAWLKGSEVTWNRKQSEPETRSQVAWGKRRETESQRPGSGL